MERERREQQGLPPTRPRGRGSKKKRDESMSSSIDTLSEASNMSTASMASSQTNSTTASVCSTPLLSSNTNSTDPSKQKRKYTRRKSKKSELNELPPKSQPPQAMHIINSTPLSHTSNTNGIVITTETTAEGTVELAPSLTQHTTGSSMSCYESIEQEGNLDGPFDGESLFVELPHGVDCNTSILVHPPSYNPEMSSDVYPNALQYDLAFAPSPSKHDTSNLNSSFNFEEVFASPKHDRNSSFLSPIKTPSKGLFYSPSRDSFLSPARQFSSPSILRKRKRDGESLNDKILSNTPIKKKSPMNPMGSPSFLFQSPSTPQHHTRDMSRKHLGKRLDFNDEHLITPPAQNQRMSMNSTPAATTTLFGGNLTNFSHINARVNGSAEKSMESFRSPSEKVPFTPERDISSLSFSPFSSRTSYHNNSPLSPRLPSPSFATKRYAYSQAESLFTALTKSEEV